MHLAACLMVMGLLAVSARAQMVQPQGAMPATVLAQSAEMPAAEALVGSYYDYYEYYYNIALDYYDSYYYSGSQYDLAYTYYYYAYAEYYYYLYYGESSNASYYYNLYMDYASYYYYL